MFGISGAGTRAPDLGPMVTFGCYASSPPGGLAVVTLYGYARGYGYADDPSAVPDPTIIEHEPTVVALAERRTSVVTLGAIPEICSARMRNGLSAERNPTAAAAGDRARRDE
ncbi:hypothetical protein Nham_1958 [Nitrobacter hamburgensis X14]|uniref:Uncharacterized protein n=1 Tax=Nitrobacter hamburgensis (strain DSM 10229 / NCIMB 13809 / X14) TaxID=323097 RepID=Q1QLY7_NITHX|nr:hypothetical protein [Nitrobacter hamburgensis]ABE62760.1 hypothetical protein Nham_1958 [Nitrobacter hamburgensis X14]